MAELTPEQVKAVNDAQAVISAHQADYVNWQNAVKAAQAAGEVPPPPPPTIADAVSVIGHTLGNVLLGIGGTVGDAIGVVGATADTLHQSVDAFFSNLRGKIGI